MIYPKAQNRTGNESSTKNITNLSGSFNNGLSSSMIGMQNTTALNARGAHGQHKQPGGGSSMQIGSMHVRPMSQYSGKVLTKKKQPSNVSEGSAARPQKSANIGSFGGQSSGTMNTIGGPTTNVINQSLKPKMIVNSNGVMQNRQMGSVVMHQHHGNSGDKHVSNFSISNANSGTILHGGRPQSLKVVKKKVTMGGSHMQPGTGGYER